MSPEQRNEVDPRKMTWASPVVWTLMIAASLVSAFLIRTEAAFDSIRTLLESESKARMSEVARVVESVDRVRASVDKLVVDSVATRQANAWIDLFRQLNRDEFPKLKIPDLPR